MTLRLPRLLSAAAFAASLPFVCAPALAQAYPTKTVTVVVAYPAGGDTDAFARIVAEKLTARLGQPVIVDNRPGASGAIGASSVMRAAPDGHTLLLAPQTMAITPLVLKHGAGVNYDPSKDFSPVAQLGINPLLLLSRAGDGPADLKQVIDKARHDKTVSYASPGMGSPMHVAAEVLNRDAGVQIRHVPYRGVAPALVDLMSGQVTVAWLSPGAVAQQLVTGKLQPLAVSGSSRWPTLPQVPTFAELGYKNVDIVPWYGLFGPKGMPASTVASLNQHVNEVLRLPDVVEKLRGLGIQPQGGEPARLQASVEADWRSFAQRVKAFGIQAE